MVVLVLGLPGALPPEDDGGLEVLELVVVAFPLTVPPLPLPDKCINRNTKKLINDYYYFQLETSSPIYFVCTH